MMPLEWRFSYHERFDIFMEEKGVSNMQMNNFDTLRNGFVNSC